MSALDEWWAALPDADRRIVRRGAWGIEAWGAVSAVLQTAPVLVAWPTGVLMVPPAVLAEVRAR